MNAESAQPPSDDATREALRAQCREAILRYLRGLSRAETDMGKMAAIYHGHYSMTHGSPRKQGVSYFLKRMEDEGLVVCGYDRDGFVISVRATR